MAMFAIALVPLIKELKPLCRQVWYADDGTGCDSFVNIRKLYDALLIKGPLYGYFMQPKKCVLVVKGGREAAANEFFGDTGVKITDGARHLGAALGSIVFKHAFVREKDQAWVKEN